MVLFFSCSVGLFYYFTSMHQRYLTRYLLQPPLMRLSLLLLLTVASALVVNPSAKYICSEEDSTDCYPQIFVPTEEWKTIKPGQEIPPGLHVRMNMETLQKEAKLMSEDERESEETPKEIGFNGGESEHFEGHKVENQVPAVYETSDVSTFNGAVNAVLRFGDRITSSSSGKLNEKDINDAAETLVDLSHDLEHGVRLTQDPKIFISILDIADSVGLDLKEKLLRIMGSSLRNNPEAIGNVLKLQNPQFINRLFDYLEDNTAEEVVKKRVIGIIHALSLNNSFKLEYLSLQRGRGIDRLVSVFPELEHSSQVRVMNILEDLGLVADLEKRQEESPQLEFSNFLQSSLHERKVVAEPQFQLYFNKLTQLHKQNKDLKPTPEFLQWLAQEANVRVEGHKDTRDISPENQNFDRQMLQARHEVFGNPNAMRKAYLDEL